MKDVRLRDRVSNAVLDLGSLYSCAYGYLLDPSDSLERAGYVGNEAYSFFLLVGLPVVHDVHLVVWRRRLGCNEW